jgi:hypothetical protein
MGETWSLVREGGLGVKGYAARRSGSITTGAGWDRGLAGWNAICQCAAQ